MNKDVFFLIANFDPKSFSSWSVGHYNDVKTLALRFVILSSILVPSSKDRRL